MWRRMAWALALLFACPVLGAVGAETGAPVPAMTEWAMDIARMMGSSPAGAAMSPNGIIMTARPTGGPASGIVVTDPNSFNPSLNSYVWTGPRVASRNTESLLQKHPGLALAWKTAAFFKLVKFIKQHPGPGPAPAPAPGPAPGPAPVPEFFVQVANGQFITGTGSGTCKYLYPAGFNKFEFVEAGAGAPRLFDAQLTDTSLTGPASVRAMLDQAQAAGLTLLRMNAFAVDSQYSVALQPGGVGNAVLYNEGVLKGLDYVLSEAQKRGIKVLLVLTDYFAGTGGPEQYLAFAGVDTSCGESPLPSCDDVKSQFFGNPTAQQLYQQYASTLANRVNTVNGRTYKNDPTIWGWDLMNEPRCTAQSICTDDGVTTIHAWVAMMSTYVKGIDSTHLVTVGLDGFYLNQPGAAANPFTNTYNTDWLDDTQAATIDFGSFNVYPDLWMASISNEAANTAWIDAWIDQHAGDAKSPLAKPIIIKELGAQPTPQRLQLYTTMLGKALSVATADRNAVGGLKGVLYFQGWVDGTDAVFWTLAQGGRFGILPGNPEFQQITQFASSSAALEQSVACPGGNSVLGPEYPPTPSCPTGWEGPNCNVDVDECVRGLDDCSANAACINTAGSFTCQCHITYFGNGNICIPELVAQASLSSAFFTNNQVNGFPGSQNVPYPTTAPGWVADPTGHFGPNGSRLKVTLFQCKLACETAGETVCTSFFYDDVSKSCFLKANECPLQQEQAPTPTTCTYRTFAEGVANPVPPGTDTYVCGLGVTYYREGAALPDGCEPQT